MTQNIRARFIKIPEVKLKMSSISLDVVTWHVSFSFKSHRIHTLLS